jgi:hypothetical protein
MPDRRIPTPISITLSKEVFGNLFLISKATFRYLRLVGFIEELFIEINSGLPTYLIALQ